MNLVIALLWMPPGVRYHVDGPPEVAEFLATQAERFAAASAPPSGD